MAVLFAALIVAAAVVGVGVKIADELRRGRDETGRMRQLSIAALFAPALSEAQHDPRALLTWQPLARALRVRFPEEFAALDASAGGAFPFSSDVISAAHARWTTDWLAWERTHDATYKLKALEAQHEMQSSPHSAAARAKLDAIEQEKLDSYQRRYQEYVQVAKALQNLTS